jgi:hypothetical protein
MSGDLNEMHQSLAINLNQETWGLLEREDRTDNDDQRMITFAKGSLYHWQRSPNCRPVNHQRGEWLISHVYAVLNRGKEALFHAEICMDITMNESLIDFDLAYAYECKARAYAALDSPQKMNKCYSNAKASGEKIKKNKDKKLFFSDLYSEPWYDIKKPKE